MLYILCITYTTYTMSNIYIYIYVYIISGFQGYWLKDTAKGPRFEETKTHIEESRDDFAERREPYP